MRSLFSGIHLIPTVALTSTLAQDARHILRKEDSPQWHNGRFENVDPIRSNYWGMARKFFQSHPHTTPSKPLPVQQVDPERFRTTPTTGLRLTWLGHSSSILELDGIRILIDPVWSERASPMQWAGPKRWYAPLIAIDSLPNLDAVLISHNHYDHLDRKVVEQLANTSTRFIVPIGLGQTLLDWGVPSHRISELDWWGSTMVHQVKVVATPARHASGRGFFDQAQSLWCGFALQGPSHKVYYSGDTGPMSGAEEIGFKLGPFDLTMIECGQYDATWPDWHMTPEQSLALHRKVRGRILVPMHWGLFKMAFHSWKDPVERITKAGTKLGSSVLVPQPGESLEPTQRPKQEPWWDSIQ